MSRCCTRVAAKEMEKWWTFQSHKGTNSFKQWASQGAMGESSSHLTELRITNNRKDHQ